MEFVNLTIHEVNPYKSIDNLRSGFYVNESTKSIAIIERERRCMEGAIRCVVISSKGEITVNPVGLNMRNFKLVEITQIAYKEIK